MKKTNLIIAFTLLVLVHYAKASGCMPKYGWLTLREYNTHTVFVGKLLSASAASESPLGVELKYQVVTNYRNTPVGDTITVYYPMSEWSAEEYQQKAIGTEGTIYVAYNMGRYTMACAPFLLGKTSVETYKMRLQAPDLTPDRVQICNNVIHSWQLIDEVKQRGNKTIKSYHPNGLLEAKGKLKNSMPDGEWKYYDDKGRLLEVTNYKEGIKWGKSKSYYYENDTLIDRSFSIYKNDRVLEGYSYSGNGKKTGYLKNNFLFMGNLNNNYKKDSLESIVLLFDADEKLYQKKEFKYDIEQPGHYHIFIEYYAPDGRLTKKGIEKFSTYYENYVQSGTWFYYDKEGNIVNTELYDANGKLISNNKNKK